VYVLDQSMSDRKFSGNGTITSVLQEEEPVPIIGKVKKKFRKELLDIELRLVKVSNLNVFISNNRSQYLLRKNKLHYL
jgi:hypothetical protein